MKEIYNQLTIREKKLLYVLCCFLIVVCGWFFVVLPGLDSYTELNIEYDNVLSQKTTLDSQLQQYLEADALLKIKKDSYESIINKYNKRMSNDNIDKMITTAVLAHGLKPKILTIADAKSTSDGNEGVKTNSSLSQSTVSVTVEGGFQQVSNFIGYLNKIKGIGISTVNNALSTNGVTTTQMNINIYMINE